MKASELIYRLARAIESNGDCEVKVAIEAINGGARGKACAESSVSCLDVNKGNLGVKYFEIYGEEQ